MHDKSREQTLLLFKLKLEFRGAFAPKTLQYKQYTILLSDHKEEKYNLKGKEENFEKYREEEVKISTENKGM